MERMKTVNNNCELWHNIDMRRARDPLIRSTFYWSPHVDQFDARRISTVGTCKCKEFSLTQLVEGVGAHSHHVNLSLLRLKFGYIFFFLIERCLVLPRYFHFFLLPPVTKDCCFGLRAVKLYKLWLLISFSIFRLNTWDWYA